MKAYWKRILSVSVAAGLLVAALAGCQGKEGTDGTSGSDGAAEGQAMGRYLEEEVPLPEGMMTVLDMVKMENGSIRLLGGNEGGVYELWDSEDSGASWEKAGELPGDIFGEEKVWISEAALSPSGEGFLCGYGEDVNMSYYHMTAQAEVSEVKLDLEELKLDESELGEYTVQAEETEESAEAEPGNAEPEGAENTDAETGNEVEPGNKGLEAGNEAEPESAEPEAGNEAKPETGNEAEPGSADAETGTEGVSGEMQTMGSGDEEEGNEIYTMETSNGLSNIRYSSGGVLFASDYRGKLYQANPETGELEKEIASEVSSFEIAGNVIAVEDYASGLALYDAATGETVGQDQALAEVIKGESGMTSYVMGVKKFLFQGGEEENSLYYCDSQGLYRHILGGSVNEQLIDGKLNSLGSPDTGLIAMSVLDDGAFLVLISQSDGSNALLKYTYSKDTPTKPGRELKLYALRDNAEIRQAISMFQKENADYYINFEVGMTGEDGVTVSDALKTLNADIMAGKGPDILVLDGMPVESYIEKGLLADMTDIFNTLKEGDGCFEKIAGTYGTEEGICAVPSRFGIPVIEGSEELLEAAGDLRAFADAAEKLREEDAETPGIVGSSSAELLVEKLYQSYSPVLLQADGSLNQEKAAEFCTQAKRIYDTGKYTEEEKENAAYSVSMMGVSEWSGIATGVMELLGGSMKANMGMLADVLGFNQVIEANKKLGMGYGLLSLAGEKVYCPQTVLGISSKSGQTEDAEKFVAYLLGKEAQEMNQGGGFPVNLAAYEASTEDTSGGETVMGYVSSDARTGEMVSLDVHWAAQEDFETFREKIDSLDTPVLTDTVIGDAVKEQAVKYLEGESTVEEAVSSLTQKVNLYLAE